MVHHIMKWTIAGVSMECCHLLYIKVLLTGAAEVCRSTLLGKEYTGTIAVTNTGKTCQPWSSQRPHPHARIYPEDFPDANVTEASNFCRNPAERPEGPWCLTMDSSTRWEYCDIHFCHQTPGRVHASANTDFLFYTFAG